MQMLINGKMTEGALAMEVINPAKGTPFAVSPRASLAQLNDAVAAATRAFLAWSKTDSSQRKKALLAIAGIIDANADDLARLLTLEQGKPLAMARFEAAAAARAFRYVAGMALDDQVINEGGTRRIELQHRPLGVVAAIVPWNYPLVLMAAKVPYALLAGNTVVIKPAPTTPLTTLRFGELIRDAAPPGVINIIAEAGDLGPALTAHPDVRKISFTGSTATGRKVMASAAPTLKRLTLELGGNDAAIVLDDADIADVAPRLFAAAFRNSGQICAAIKRLYAPPSLYDGLCDALADLSRKAVVGDGLDEATQFGPLQNRPQFDRVCGLIDEAERTATVIAGGKMQSPGYFVRPTIVRDITDGCPLVDEEQFGPVLPVIRYSHPEEALARANASPYGLGGSIWSPDLNRARRYAEQLDCGAVWINKHAEMGPDIAFAGSKQSGIGVEYGTLGLAEFTQVRVINTALAPA